MAPRQRQVVRFSSRAELRAWLTEHADTSGAVDVLLSRRRAATTGLTYEQVVLECLCFGWIDSTQRRHDEDLNAQMIAPRRPSSTWTGVNKARVQRLTEEGLMTPAGLRAVAVARANGSWTVLDSVERGDVPDELIEALDTQPAAREFFDALPPGVRRAHVWHVVSAKRPETRARRVAAILDAAREGRRLL